MSIESELVRHWAEMMKAFIHSIATSPRDYRRRLRALGISP